MKIKKILEVHGHPASGLKTLFVEIENGKKGYIDGDWRMVDHIIEAVEEGENPEIAQEDFRGYGK